MRLSCKRLFAAVHIAALLAALAIITGCQSPAPRSSFQDYDPGSWTPPGQTNPPVPAAPDPSTHKPTKDRPSSASTDVFRVGDVVSVTFSGISEQIPAHEERIKEDGTITLFLIKS